MSPFNYELLKNRFKFSIKINGIIIKRYAIIRNI